MYGRIGSSPAISLSGLQPGRNGYRSGTALDMSVGKGASQHDGNVGAIVPIGTPIGNGLENSENSI